MADAHKVVIAPAWLDLAEAIAAGPGAILILGGADSGKSTLARLLAVRCHEMGLRTVLVDCDLGQSVLGLPSTISATAVVSSERLNAASPLFQFVGAVSPQGHVDRVITSLGDVMGRVRELGPQAIVIDTTGFIDGAEARELKHRKMDLLRPKHVAALQRGDELEHILTPRCGTHEPHVHRLAVCADVRKRSQQERRRLREEKFGEYFREAKLLELDTGRIVFRGDWFRPGQRLPDRTLETLSGILEARVLYGEKDAKEVTLVAAGPGSEECTSEICSLLNSERVRTVDARSFADSLLGLGDERGRSLALSIVKELGPEDNNLLVYAPLVSCNQVRTAEFSFLKLRLSGEEISQG